MTLQIVRSKVKGLGFNRSCPAICQTMASVKLPMNLGVSRYVCQLKRLTLQYCKAGGSSKGIREYIDNHVIQFAKENPSCAVYVRFRPGRAPRLIGEYLNNSSRVVAVPNFTCKEVQNHVSLLRTSSGVKAEKLKKYWHTDRPTIQGNWSPFLNK